MVARKLLADSKEKPQRVRKKLKSLRRGVKLESLPNAIVDGKLNATKDTLVAFERTQYGKTSVHVGRVFSIDSEEMLTLWDETLGQFCPFQVKGQTAAIKLVTEAEITF